jgi:hypothetical protein
MLALALMKDPPSPKQFQRHMWSSLLTINYNHPPAKSEDDPAVVGVTNHILRIMQEVHPGMRLVEFFPSMKYIPSWCVHCFAYRILLSSHRGIQVRQMEKGRTILVHPRLAEERTPSDSSRGRLCTCTLQCSTSKTVDRCQHQTKGIDRPCVASTLLKNQEKYSLSGRERAWLLGDIVYVL